MDILRRNEYRKMYGYKSVPVPVDEDKRYQPEPFVYELEKLEEGCFIRRTNFEKLDRER